MAIILIAGGLWFDRHETRAYTECMNGPWAATFEAGDLSASKPDPDAYTGNLYLFSCEDANRIGLAVAGIGAVLVGVSVIVWWARRWAAGSEWE